MPEARGLSKANGDININQVDYFSIQNLLGLRDPAQLISEKPTEY